MSLTQEQRNVLKEQTIARLLAKANAKPDTESRLIKVTPGSELKRATLQTIGALAGDGYTSGEELLSIYEVGFGDADIEDVDIED